MDEETQRGKYITPIAIGFMTMIVPDFLGKAFDAYEKRDFNTENWQVSNWEQWYGGAGVALAVSAIEANRNRFFYIKGMPPSGNVCKDMVEIFSRVNSFPTGIFGLLIDEVFTIRNVILHSHIYEIDAQFRSADWKMMGLEQKRLEGYGNNRFDRSVDTKGLKTKLLSMNVQTAKIGFEELFMVLLVFDLIVGIVDKSFGKGYFVCSLHQKLNDCWIQNLSELLTFYFDKVPSNSFKSRVNKLAGDFRAVFGSFMEGSDYFITNLCPKCHSLGFSKSRRLSECNACNLKIRF